jgi:hypothetical protein
VRYPLGRALELLGLTLVGLGLVVGLVRNELRYEERMFFAGGAAFVVGWLLVRPFRKD